eukprot:7266070-Lingulodinium_polyedra.AAC.1
MTGRLASMTRRRGPARGATGAGAAGPGGPRNNRNRAAIGKRPTRLAPGNAGAKRHAACPLADLRL